MDFLYRVFLLPRCRGERMSRAAHVGYLPYVGWRIVTWQNLGFGLNLVRLGRKIAHPTQNCTENPKKESKDTNNNSKTKKEKNRTTAVPEYNRPPSKRSSLKYYQKTTPWCCSTPFRAGRPLRLFWTLNMRQRPRAGVYLGGGFGGETPF